MEITNAINNGQVPPPPPDAVPSSGEVASGIAAMQISSPELPISAASTTQTYVAPSFNNNYIPPPVVPVLSAPAVSIPTGYAPQAMFPQVRSPPVTNADPRVKDTVELCHFAIAALKVSLMIY